MKRLIVLFGALVLSSAFLQTKAQVVSAPVQGKPVPVIIETDMGNDVDDALALDLAYKAVRDGLIDLKMISLHKKSETAAPFVDRLNNWFGYPEILISKSSTPVDNPESHHYTESVVADSRYQPTGKYTDGYPDAVKAYREILAGAEDHSVVIVSLGFAPTLARLLDTRADEFSTYNGRKLVSKKVKYLSIMAGSYGPQDSIPSAGGRVTMFDSFKKRSEYNIYNDIPDMQKVFAEWPTPIYQNAFELGKMVYFPGSAFMGIEGNPVVDAYSQYEKMPFDRPSWDILSISFILHPELFTMSEPVTVSVDDKGFCHVKKGGNHRVLSLTGEQADALLDFEVKQISRGNDYLPAWEEGFLDIHCLGTGQGDCNFMVLPDGTTWMIDAGDIGFPDGDKTGNWYHTVPNPSKPVGEWIVDYINHFSPTPGRLDYASLTHFHADHLGSTRNAIEGANGYRLSGLTLVGDRIRFCKYVDRDYPDYDFPSRTQVLKADNLMNEYFKFIDYQKGQGMQIEKMKVGSNSQFVLVNKPRQYKNFEVRNLCANGEVWVGHGRKTIKMYSGDTALFDENMNSCGWLISYGDFKYYQCGDVGGGNNESFKSKERNFEKYLADIVGKITLMKPDHHGWRESSNAVFLSQTRPDAIVFMGSHKHHPYPATMRRLVDPLVYEGEREFYNTTESSRAELGEHLWGFFKPTGHVVFRVYPGGKKWQVFVLDEFSGDYRIKYRSDVKTVLTK